MDDLTREAERLYNDIKKYCGTNDSPNRKTLEAMARKLYDDFRGIHNPRMLEKQANEIKEYMFHSMRGDEMQTVHCSELKSGYEHLRLELRKFE